MKEKTSERSVTMDVLPSCNLVLDGTNPPEQNALELLQFIQAKS